MPVPRGPTENEPASLLDIQTEFGGAAPISLGEYYAGGLYVSNPAPTSIYQTGIVPTSGPISIGNFLGLRKGYVFTETVSGNFANYNLRTRAQTLGAGSNVTTTWNGTEPLYANVTFAGGSIIYSTSTGSPAFQLGSIPAGSIISLTNNGLIQGRGGAGGAGGTVNGTTLTNGGGGGGGGPAMLVTFQMTVANNGQIAGGSGGGGGGAAGWYSDGKNLYCAGGGGAGGARAQGPGGGGGFAVNGNFNASGGPGGTATLTASAGGGGGGSPGAIVGGTGGAGGGLGGNGASGGGCGGSISAQSSPGGGGPVGIAVSGDSLVTWTPVGLRYGGITG